MKTNELAEKLEGIEYRTDFPEELMLLAKEEGLVVVHGYSDDNIELNGAIYEEISAYDGGSAFVTKDGLFQNVFSDMKK